MAKKANRKPPHKNNPNINSTKSWSSSSKASYVKEESCRRSKSQKRKKSSASNKKSYITAATSVVALVSFFTGIITPPLLSFRQQNYKLKSDVKTQTTVDTVGSLQVDNTEIGKNSVEESDEEDDGDEHLKDDDDYDDGGDNYVSSIKSWLYEMKASSTNGRKNVNNNTEKQKKQKLPCTTHNLSQYLHDKPIPGMHIICCERGGTNLILYINASRDAIRRRSVEINLEGSYKLFRQILVSNFNLASEGRGRVGQPWAIFTSQGERVMSEVDKKHAFPSIVHEVFLREGMLLLMEGGTWIWPGVREGFQRTVELYSPVSEDSNIGSKRRQQKQQNPIKHTPRNITIETLSLSPLILSIENFISESECNYIQRKAQSTIRYSDVTLMDKDKGKKSTDWRTSQSTFLASTTDAQLDDLDWRTADLTKSPKDHQEHIQVLRYGYEEKYSAHHDFFHPAQYKNDPTTMRLIENGKKNRFATVLWYLSDVEEGGHTIFPRVGGRPSPRDVNDCANGLKVKPEKGKVIIFYNLLANGVEDDLSLHGACPVIRGIKWAANKWVWNAPMNYI